MKYIFLVVLFVATISCNRHALPSSTPITNAEIKNAKGDTILTGHCSVSILQNQPYKTWFDKSYNNYQVDTPTAMLLKPLLETKQHRNISRKLVRRQQARSTAPAESAADSGFRHIKASINIC